ncbi:MAG: NAD(P)/FAD-dependent oxidoreductase [Oscillospiraceae bacterium]|jgi:thioredoxin reductase (NADPH)
MRDVIIIGGGPAGLSAAVNLRARGKDVLIISNKSDRSGLWKAEKINNYLGLPGITGRELIERFEGHALDMGVETIYKRVLSAMASGGGYFVSFGNEVQEARALLIAGGVVPTKKYEGEERLLGRGVSYCATCDGMLYRGRRVVVTGNSPDVPEEADYLREIGCEVSLIKPKKLRLVGEDRLEAVEADGERIECDGLFILRPSIAPKDFLPDLRTKGGYITTDKNGRTNLKGVWAAGDCTGKPLQIAKAVGEGQTAALDIVEFLG